MMAVLFKPYFHLKTFAIVALHPDLYRIEFHLDEWFSLFLPFGNEQLSLLRIKKSKEKAGFVYHTLNFNPCQSFHID